MKTVATARWVLGSVVAVAWVVEASTVGRGFISTYLAPLAFGPLFASAVLRMWAGRAGADTGRLG